MIQKHLGVFRFGHQNIDVYTLPSETGGEFYFAPDSISLPRIKIGLLFDNWDECLAVALHELMEFGLCAADMRYKHSGNLNGDSADYVFVFDHSQFGRVCSRAALAAADIIPKLATEWRNARKKRLRKKS